MDYLCQYYQPKIVWYEKNGLWRCLLKSQMMNYVVCLFNVSKWSHVSKFLPLLHTFANTDPLWGESTSDRRLPLPNVFSDDIFQWHIALQLYTYNDGTHFVTIQCKWNCKIVCFSASKPTIIGYPNNKVHGANMGPTWTLLVPDGPDVGPMNLAISVVFCRH